MHAYSHTNTWSASFLPTHTHTHTGTWLAFLPRPMRKLSGLISLWMKLFECTNSIRLPHHHTHTHSSPTHFDCHIRNSIRLPQHTHTFVTKHPSSPPCFQIPAFKAAAAKQLMSLNTLALARTKRHAAQQHSPSRPQK